MITDANKLTIECKIRQRTNYNKLVILYGVRFTFSNHSHIRKCIRCSIYLYPSSLCITHRRSSGTKCELSLFDVLFSPLPRGFFSGFSGFPPSVKINMWVECCLNCKAIVNVVRNESGANLSRKSPSRGVSVVKQLLLLLLLLLLLFRTKWHHQ
jgi:hypothetical protein